MKSKQGEIQENEYKKPYHYLLDEDSGYGIEYHSYLKIVESLIPKNTKKILDFGCGEGFFCNKISNKFPEVVGIDLSKAAIKMAKDKSSKAKFYCSSLDGCELKNVQFDVITMIEVLEHIDFDLIPSIVTGLSEKIKPSGRLIVTVPSIKLPLQDKHFQHFSVSSLEKTLDSHFDLVSIDGHYKKPGIGYKIIKNLLENPFYKLRINFLNSYLKQHFIKNLESCNTTEGLRLIAIFKPKNASS